MPDDFKANLAGAVFAGDGIETVLGIRYGKGPQTVSASDRNDSFTVLDPDRGLARTGGARTRRKLVNEIQNLLEQGVRFVVSLVKESIGQDTLWNGHS